MALVSLKRSMILRKWEAMLKVPHLSEAMPPSRTSASTPESLRHGVHRRSMRNGYMKEFHPVPFRVGPRRRAGVRPRRRN
jgi:hypothetical protein